MDVVYLHSFALLLAVVLLSDRMRSIAGQETLDAQWGDETGPCRDGPCLVNTVPWTRTTEYLQLQRLIAELQQLRQYCDSQSHRIDSLQQRNSNLTWRVTQLESHVGVAEEYIDAVRDECRLTRNVYGGKSNAATIHLDDGSKTPDGHCPKTTNCGQLEFQLNNVTRIVKKQSRRQRRHGHRLKALKRELREQGNSIVELNKTFSKKLATMEKKLTGSGVEYLNDDDNHLKSTADVVSEVVGRLWRDNARLRRQCLNSRKRRRKGNGL